MSIDPLIDPAKKVEAAKPLTEDEERKIRKMMNRVRFDVMKLQDNFNSKLKILWPVSGYVATLHKNSIFYMDMIDRNLFRGISKLTVNFDGKFRDIEGILKKINLFIRDETHLGANGWIGMYDTRGVETMERYCIIAVTSLSASTYDKMHEKIKAMNGKKTISETMKELEVFRRKSKEQRNLLIALFLKCSGVVESYSAAVAASSAASAVEATEIEYTIIQKWLPILNFIPEDFKIPSRNPNLFTTSLEPKTLHGGVSINSHVKKNLIQKIHPVNEPDWDIIMDDIYPYNETHYCRISSSCNVNNDAGIIPNIKGPIDPIWLYKKTDLTTPILNNKFETWCVESERETTTNNDISDITKHDITWEDAAIAFPRILLAKYVAFSTTAIPGYHREQICHPLFVRCSLADENDMIFSFTDKKRFSGFASDTYEWIV